MNEKQENPNIEAPDDMDSALQALLGDLGADTATAEEDPEPVEMKAAPEEQPQANLEPTPAQPQNDPAPFEPSIPTELPPLPLEANPHSPFQSVEEEYPIPSAVDESPAPRPKFQPSSHRSRRKWPLVLVLVILCTGGPGIYFGLQHDKQPEKPSEVLAELPPELELPPMDEAFLPSAEETPVPHEPAEAAGKVAPPNHAREKTVPEAHHPEQPVTEVKSISIPTLRAMDSVKLANVSGSMKNNSVQFRFDLVLFSKETGLRGKLPPFEEAIRAVALNIFYFTVPGKAVLPEIEQQVLQKAGFLFPDGRLIRVEVRNLELEPVKR